MRIAISAVAVMGLLTGCGPETDPTEEKPIDYGNLEITRPSTEALVLADEKTLDQHIKNGLRLAIGSVRSGSSSSGGSSGWGGSSTGSSSGGFSSSSSSSSSAASSTGAAGGGNSSSGMTPDPNSPPEDGSGGDAPWSDTNVHVDGVDESDFAKYDGKYWYVATSEVVTADFIRTGKPGFQIIAPDHTVPDAEILSKFEMDDPWGTIGQMYLVSDADATSHVVLLREQAGNIQPMLPSWESPFDFMGGAGGFYRPQNGQLRLQLVNVEDPSKPAEDFDIKVDGTLVDSRKIGDVIYLVTRFEPWIEELQVDYGDATVRKENEATLTAKPVTELLPHYQLGEANRKPLSSDCYVQGGLTEDSGFSSLVHITAIDLRQQKLLASRCVNSSITSISMSLESLYLTGVVPDPSSWNNGDTVIHKFSLDEDDGLLYAATGSVEGSIQGNSDPAFRLHEHEDDLRVVTTRWVSGPEHALYILRQNGKTLEQLAQLPNDDRPELLGKPNEDIYSVRFEAERAFIVTFQRTDPLYMIDLTDPLDPFVAGELEIPGFATYMHPLNSQYLFTLGQDADENGRVEGIKAELIDVSEGAPVSVMNVVFGDSGSYSEALQNLRALNLLKVNDSEWRVAFPYHRYEYRYSEADNEGKEFVLNGLQLLQISGLDGEDAQLSDAGLLVAENGEAKHYSSFVSRGLLQGEAAFYAHKNAVWAAPWGAVEDAVGPIKTEPEACTPSVYNGVELELLLEANAEHDACKAIVTIADGEYVESLVPLEGSQAGNSCTFAGAAGRPGAYWVEATLQQFEPISNYYVEVWSDGCNVQTQKQSIPMYECGYFAGPPVSLTISSAEPLDCEGKVSLVQDGVEYPMTWYGGSDGGWSGSSSTSSSGGWVIDTPVSSSSSSGFSTTSSSSGAFPGSSSSSGFSGSGSTSTSSSSSTSTTSSTSGSGHSARYYCSYDGGAGLSGVASLVIEIEGHAPHEEGINIPERSCLGDAVEFREVFLKSL